VLLASRLATRSGIADPPPGATGRNLLGTGNAAGIGFTVALFVAELAFQHEEEIADAKMAILLASVVSGLLAYFVLRGAPVADAERADVDRAAPDRADGADGARVDRGEAGDAPA